MISTEMIDFVLSAPAPPNPPVNVDINRDAATEELVWRTAAILVVGGLLVLMWNYAPRVLLVALAVGALMLIGSIG